MSSQRGHFVPAKKNMSLMWLRRSVIRQEDASVTTFWERWVLIGSVSLRPLGIRL